MDTAPATILKINKSVNDKVYHLGYEYHKDGHNCANYKSLKRPGRLIRYLDAPAENQFKISKEDAHVGDGTLVGKAKVMANMKRHAKQSSEMGRNVVAKLNENVDVSVAASLAKTSSMMQRVRRESKNLDLPKNPTSLNELIIPEELKVINGQLFLLYDSGRGPNRIIIYSTVRNLHVLAEADIMSIDGTSTLYHRYSNSYCPRSSERMVRAASVYIASEQKNLLMKKCFGSYPFTSQN